MARYYMHLRDGTEEVLDPDGCEFATLEALRSAVLFTVCDLLAGDAQNGQSDLRFRIDAHDDAGAIVYSLPFKYALDIITVDNVSPIGNRSGS